MKSRVIRRHNWPCQNAIIKNANWARANGNDECVIKCYNFHLSNYVVDKKKKTWMAIMCNKEKVLSFIGRYTFSSSLSPLPSLLPSPPPSPSFTFLDFSFLSAALLSVPKKKSLLSKSIAEKKNNPTSVQQLPSVRMDKNMLPSLSTHDDCLCVSFNHWRCETPATKKTTTTIICNITCEGKMCYQRMMLK